MIDEITCPYCGDIERQVKCGRNTMKSGQRFQCNICKRRYTPNSHYGGSKPIPPEFKERALELFSEGLRPLEIAKELGIHKVTLMKWFDFNKKGKTEND